MHEGGKGGRREKVKVKERLGEGKRRMHGRVYGR